MQDVPRRADDFLQNIQVAFMWRNQVAATSGRHPLCKSKRALNMFVHRNPARCRGTGAATFGAVLNVDLAAGFSLTAKPWQVSQDGLTQAHAGGSRQQNNCGGPLLMIAAKRIDNLFNLFAFLALRH
ncbi:hypothetical protein D3C76_1144170 [compost metagenome]